MNDVKRYCWMFGEHKDDPCACGWASANDPETKLVAAIAERDAAIEDRNEYAKSALVAIAAAGIPTPEAGYVKDGGWLQMAADIRRMRTEGRHIDKLNAAIDHVLSQRDAAL